MLMLVFINIVYDKLEERKILYKISHTIIFTTYFIFMNATGDMLFT